MPIPVKRSWRAMSIGRSTRSELVVELDVLVEDDRALLVLHDVVTVETVPVLVEIVLAFRALMTFDRKDRVAYRLRLGGSGLVDGDAEDGDRVVRPGRLIIRRGLGNVAVHFSEGLRGFARILGVIGDAVRIIERRAGELRRHYVDDR